MSRIESGEGRVRSLTEVEARLFMAQMVGDHDIHPDTLQAYHQSRTIGSEISSSAKEINSEQTLPLEAAYFLQNNQD